MTKYYIKQKIKELREKKEEISELTHFTGIKKSIAVVTRGGFI